MHCTQRDERQQKRTNLFALDHTHHLNSAHYLVYNEKTRRMSSVWKNEKVEKTVEILIVIFGMYLLFQLIKIIFGGSWSSEDMVIALLIFDTSCLFTVIILIVQVKTDLGNLKSQFRALATDFKAHLKKKAE